MNKTLMCMCTAVVFFVGTAIAQSTPSTDSSSPAGQGTQSTSPSMNGQTGTSTPDASQGSTSGATAGSTQGTMSGDKSSDSGMKSSDSNMNMKGEKGDKKMKGCIQSQGGQYMLQTKHGKDVMLSGQDVSAHVGHEVTVHGMWAGSGSSGMSNTSSASGSASGKSFNVTGVDMISETCSMGKGNKNNMSSSGSTGSSTTPPQ